MSVERREADAAARGAAAERGADAARGNDTVHEADAVRDNDTGTASDAWPARRPARIWLRQTLTDLTRSFLGRSKRGLAYDRDDHQGWV